MAEQAEKARFKAEVEAWEAKEAESASPVKAEPVVHGEEIPAEKGWCDWTLEFICRCKRKNPGTDHYLKRSRYQDLDIHAVRAKILYAAAANEQRMQKRA